MSPLFKKQKETEKGVKDKKPDEKSHATKSSEDALRPAAPDGDKPVPLLNDEDEKFLERLVSTSDDGNDEEEGPPPPLPPRPKTPVLTWDSDSESSRLPDKEEPGASTTTVTKKPNRFSRLFHRSKPSSSSTSLTVPTNTVPPEEADREWADLNRFLSRLDLQSTTASPDATPKKAKAKAAALTASAEVQSLLRQFLLVLKDITNGAPTAVDDLVALLDGRNDALKRGFDKLPSSMQKLVTQLPKKLTGALGPEILAAAAEAQGLKGGKRETDGGFTKFLLPRNLGDLVMTPAVVQSMLKAIVNALKLRWPAFAGTSVLWSSAVFLLLFVLWYCHKRGREEREKLEEAGRTGDVEEVADAEEAGSSAVVVVESPAESPRP
jgi:hypothetical protein